MKKLLKQTQLNFSIIILLLIIAIGFNSCKKTTEPILTPDPTSVADADGNVYGVIKIGSQFWMSENLRTTKYNDGTLISTNLDNASWSSATVGAYAIYDDNVANNSIYGKLYNWHAVNTGKLAPIGWHVANTSDWNALVTALGGSSVAGGKMKSTSTLWNAPNTDATNSSGFSGLASGYRATTGGYSTLGNTGYFWSSKERNSTQGDYLSLSHSSATSFSNGATKTFGYAVRCVKD
jgi:uncharacterized protein (TIGR02145 family)